MLQISLAPDEEFLLDEAASASALPPEEIISNAIRSTLNYFRVHGCLSYVTTELKQCHGCRFLNAQTCDCHLQAAPNIIPFRA